MANHGLEPARPFSESFRTTDGEEHQYALPFTDRQGTVRVIVSGDIVLTDSQTVVAAPSAPWAHVNTEPFVELNFMVQGSLYQTQSGLLDRYRYVQGYHNWLFNPQSWEQNELIGTGHFRTVSVHVAPARMMQLLTGYVPELQAVAETIEQQTPFVRHTPMPGFSPRISYLLNTLWDSPQPAGLKRLYVDSLTLELLCQQCETFMREGQPAGQAMPKGTDRDKLYYARSILLQQLDAPPSLTELARLCQLNEFSLKRGFRQLFGTSVFGFVQEHRLETARQLLYTGQKTISEIAYELGYTHPQHFHRLFKKRYGITPKQLTRS